MDGTLVPEGSAAPRVKIEQVKEEEGDYHHLFFEAAPKGGCLRWSVELGEAGSSRSWRNSRIGIATRTDEIDRSPNQRAGLNLDIATGGAFVERRGGLDKTTHSSGRTRPGQALVFELDLSGDGFFAIYHGVKAAGSSWVPGELVHKCTSCVDASLKDYEWHPCVARERPSLSVARAYSRPWMIGTCALTILASLSSSSWNATRLLEQYFTRLARSHPSAMERSI